MWSTDILMITDIPAGVRTQPKDEKSLMAQLLASCKFLSPVTPLIPEGAEAKPHIILFLSSPSQPTFHYTSPVHPTGTSIAISGISLCASLEAAVGEFTSPSVSLKCIPSLAIRWLDTGDLCCSSACGAHTRVIGLATNGSQVEIGRKKKGSEIPSLIILPLHLPPPVPWWFMFATHLSERGLSSGNPAVWLTACQWGSSHQSRGGP